MTNTDPDEAVRAASNAIDAWCAPNPVPTWPLPRPPDAGAQFGPIPERVEVTYIAPQLPLASARTQFANRVPGTEAESERIASGWPWGAWWLLVRGGVHFEDRDAVKGRYEIALGWARARGAARDMIVSLVVV